ncbi:MAG: hypothetical protein NC419_04945 [Muribaculaceae bacterium]|nr:hypothetical protein [Muribaculaceae bacterium]
MKKVLLIDYYGMCDKSGKAVGHSPKVLREYAGLLRGGFEVSAAVSPCLGKGIEGTFQKVYFLKYDICTENGMSIGKRIKDKFKLFSNISSVLKIDGYDIYWFYKTDFFLFFFLALMSQRTLKQKKKGGKKWIAQIYQDSFGSGMLQNLLNRLFQRGMQKFDGIIYSQKKMAIMHPDTLYFPDYYYDSEKYKKYETLEKKEKAVCLGTMNPYKKLDALVEVFNQNGYPLEIKGYFYDKDFYQSLCQKAGENIVIEDRILTEDEYYTTLAGAKYTVLPYDMEQYKSRTSGVLIESLFLNTIAVAPVQLLEENQFEGIGYERIEELADIGIFQQEFSWDSAAKRKEFDKGEVRDRLRGFLD